MLVIETASGELIKQFKKIPVEWVAPPVGSYLSFSYHSDEPPCLVNIKAFIERCTVNIDTAKGEMEVRVVISNQYIKVVASSTPSAMPATISIVSS